MAEMQSSQPQYNIIWRAPEAEVFDLCWEAGISQIVWSPLAQGVLTGKYKPGEEHPEDSRAASDEMGWAMDRYMSDEVLTAVQRLEPIADAAGLTMVQMALAWVLRRKERRLGDHRRLAARAGDLERLGLGDRALKGRAGGDRQGRRGRDGHRADAGRLRPGRRQAPLTRSTTVWAAREIPAGVQRNRRRWPRWYGKVGGLARAPGRGR